MLKTLIVDDSTTFRKTFRSALCERFPFMLIEEAQDATDALQKIKTFLPDVIFMDIRLPGKNGLELTQRIKTSHPEIAIIILTVYDLMAIAIGVLVVTACFLSVSIAFADMPAADPDALWHYITKVSPYTEWSFWSDHQGMQPSRAPHGKLHKVYVNSFAVNSPKPPVKEGAIVVKENYNEVRALKAITVMYKVHGYNPNDGDWFWVKYTPDGAAKPFGKPAGCIGCHGTRSNNDFILLHEFK